VSLDELARERWVVRSKSSGTRNKTDGALNDAGIDENELDIVAEMGSTQAVLSAVAAGMGIALVSDRAAAEPSKGGLVSSAEISGADLAREFYAIYSTERPLSRAAEEFLKVTCGE
jgi:DNA-binding transcriptional LysR family regulator